MRNGFAWSFIENISLQLTRFIIGIIMARLLSPSDYGLIGMLTVFIVVSDLFVNSGIGSALNQKGDRTESDYSTAFIFNTSVGILCYAILFIGAPLIAKFYNEPRLIDLLRWLSVVVIIKSLGVVPLTQMQIDLKFKEISIISFASATILGFSGVLLAYQGFGVWALVYSNIIGALFSLICYIFGSKWMPRCWFSINAFKNLFSYGSRLLIATFIDVIYNNIYPLVIGKFYSAQQLGYYSRAQGYATLPTGTLSSMIYRVCFPVFCREKDSYNLLIENYSKIMRVIAYLIIPIMMLLLILSKQLVIILITEKWLPCVTLLQILCLSTLWSPIMEVNYSIIKALGNSKAILRMQVISKIFAIIVLIITTRYNIEIMCIGAVGISLFNLCLNFVLSKNTLQLNISQQLKMILIPLIGGACMPITILVMNLFDNIYFQLVTGFFVSLMIYILITTILGVAPQRIYQDIRNI